VDREERPLVDQSEVWHLAATWDGVVGQYLAGERDKGSDERKRKGLTVQGRREAWIRKSSRSSTNQGMTSTNRARG
jgi:hypothetical protein